MVYPYRSGMERPVDGKMSRIRSHVKITDIGLQGRPWTQFLRSKPRDIYPILPALRSETKVSFHFTYFVW